MRKCLIHLRASFFIIFMVQALGFLPTHVHAAVPTVTTPETAWVSGRFNKQSSVTAATARIGAFIASDGGTSVTAHGTTWGLAPSPTGNMQDDGTGSVGAFLHTRTSLPVGSLIYFRGFATNADGGPVYSPDGTFYTEPANQPTNVTIDQVDYFSLRVNWEALPADTDGVLVAMRSQAAVQSTHYAYDGTVYTADASFGSGDELELYYREYIVYDGSGTSVVVTNLQAGVTYHVALFAYKGSGTGISGINYINSSTVATASATTTATTGISHNEQNIPNYTDNTGCANCHGSHHTTDLLPRGLAQYNRCFVCHSTGGGANPNIGLHLADGSIDCGSCHTMHSFRTSELYSDAADHGGTTGFNQKFIRTNMSKYINTTDFTPPSGPPKDALDNTVFQNSPDHFAFTTGDTPYNGICQTCHTETNFHTQTGVSDNTHQIGNNCVNCHAHSTSNEYNAFKFSGHADTDFGWSGNCKDCHGAGAGAEAVVSIIHANNCDLCHTTGGPYNSSTEKAGNNGNGDATAADGAAADTPKFDATIYNCILCHAAANAGVTPATIGGIHHNNTGTIPYDPSQCTACHTAVDHISMLADAPGDCNNCHTLTEALPGVNPPLSTGDPKVHDMCLSCHVIAPNPDYNGDLVTIGTAIKGLPTGKLPAGGGECVVCHTDINSRPKSAGMHHTNTLATDGTCHACHINNYDSTGVGGPTVVDVQQLACRECHVDEATNGLDVRSLSLALGTSITPSQFDNGQVASHVINHTGPIAIQDYRACFACHNGDDAGAAVIAPFHGFPGNLSTESFFTGEEPFNTSVTAAIDENNWNGRTTGTPTQGHPLVFQYYHPGHNSFRVFGETTNMTRRSTRPGTTYNYRMCKRQPYNNSDCEQVFRRGSTVGGIDFRAYADGNTSNAGRKFETPVPGFDLRIPNIPYNQFGTGGPFTNVPRFDNLVSVPDDRIFVNSAEVKAGGDLIVIASNDEQGCDLLTVITQPDATPRGNMTLNGATGYCELTVISVSPIPATVDVNSSGTGTPSVTGFPVTDNS